MDYLSAKLPKKLLVPKKRCLVGLVVCGYLGLDFLLNAHATHPIQIKDRCRFPPFSCPPSNFDYYKSPHGGDGNRTPNDLSRHSQTPKR
jgi:hypothetical protein